MTSTKASKKYYVIEDVKMGICLILLFLFFVSEVTNDSWTYIFDFGGVRDRKKSLVLTMVNFMITA